MNTIDLRIPLSQIAGVPKADKPWKSVEGAERALAGCGPDDETAFLRTLTPGQRALLSVSQLSAEVLNGGFGQYFWNSTCRLADEALKGLKQVGANEYAKLLRQAIAAAKLTKEDFQNTKARRAKLKRLHYGKFFEEFDTRFYDLEENSKGNLNRCVQAYYQALPSDFHITDTEYSRQLEKNVEQRRTKEYRIGKPKGRIKPEALTWKLIEKVWDNYLEELKAGKERFQQFLSCISTGQRAVIAIDILNKSILQLDGVAGFVVNTTGGEMLCEEVRRGYSVLAAKPYEVLWAEWIGKANNLIKVATACQQAGQAYASVRDTQGKDAAAELGKEYMQRNRESRVEKEMLKDEAEKFDNAFRGLLKSKRTAIEVFILRYVEKHPDDFIFARRFGIADSSC